MSNIQSFGVIQSNSTLQKNQITITFNLATDITVPGLLVTTYRYRLVCADLYCGYHTPQDNQPSIGPVLYDADATYSLGYTDLTEGSGLLQVDSTNQSGSFSLTVPELTYDYALWVYIEPYDDETKKYLTDRYTVIGPIAAFANRTPEFYCTSIKWKKEDNNDAVEINWSIVDAGILKPAEGEFGSDAWNSYANTLSTVTANRKFLPSVICTNKLTTDHFEFQLDELPITEWYPHALPTVTLKDSRLTSSVDWNIQIQVKISKITGTIDFDYVADSSATYYSNMLLLNSLVPAFQIKRRGIKVHLLENDSTLGIFSTGAGMFNHGEEVGVDVSGGTPSLDNSKGHSIALYDTRADGDHASNEPSIGFMNDKHETMGYLKYGVASDGRPALLSNLPIIGNNNSSVTYNMSIDLILGNNEVKTISFNGKLS